MVQLLAQATSLVVSSAISSFTLLKSLRHLIIPPFCCGKSVPSAPITDGSDSHSPVKEPLFQRFSWTEIELFTNGFTSDVIGEGGFSTVYLARLPDSSLAAVKLHRSGNSTRLLRAFEQELDVLRRLSNPKIVRLIGYSDSALVFEYIPGGTLRERLAGGEPPLPWGRRLSIALRVAEAVDYLHEGGELPIVHGDITPSNVLLDDRRGRGPKLCDFGLATVGFSAAVKKSNLIIGSPGYADPHYLRTGILSKKSDVYSFGVMLLELITGLPAISEQGGMRLADALGDAAVDPMLCGEFGEEEADAAIRLAALCVGDKPSLRPSMVEVIRTMRKNLPSSMSTMFHK